MEKQNKTYYGNFFWVMEALKITNKEINFDKNIDLSKLVNSDIIFYDCLVINDDKEDSVFFHVTVKNIIKFNFNISFKFQSELNEYFSHDKCELILKLLKLYEKKFYSKELSKSGINSNANALNSNLMKTELPPIKSNYNRLNTNNNLASSETLKDSDLKNPSNVKINSGMKALSTIMFGNMFILYKNNKSNFILNLIIIK